MIILKLLLPQMVYPKLEKFFYEKNLQEVSERENNMKNLSDTLLYILYTIYIYWFLSYIEKVNEIILFMLFDIYVIGYLSRFLIDATILIP